WLLWIGVIATGLAAFAPIGRTERLPAPATAPEAARLLMEAPAVGEARISPDGAYVMYSVSRRDVQANRVSTEMFLQALVGGKRGAEEPVRLASHSGDRSGYWNAQWDWCPDSRCITYFPPPTAAKDPGRPLPLLRYDVGSRQATPIPI